MPLAVLPVACVASAGPKGGRFRHAAQNGRAHSPAGGMDGAPGGTCGAGDGDLGAGGSVGGVGGGSGGFARESESVTAALPTPRSAAIPSDMKVAEDRTSASLAPSAVSVHARPTETTDVPLRRAPIDSGRESSTAMATASSASTARSLSGSLENDAAESRRAAEATAVLRLSVMARRMGSTNGGRAGCTGEGKSGGRGRAGGVGGCDGGNGGGASPPPASPPKTSTVHSAPAPRQSSASTALDTLA